MKHLFLFFTVAMTVATVHAQLEVDSMGNICVNTSTDQVQNEYSQKLQYHGNNKCYQNTSYSARP